MVIGVLALQGAFIEHENILKELGVESIELRNRSDLDKHYDGLILPGGESTVQGKLLKSLGMFDKLKEQIESGMPVLATCAGMILLSEKVDGEISKNFGPIPMNVKRNAYGRQLGSFHTVGKFKGIGNIPMSFIRAPYVESVSSEVEVLSIVNEKIVAVRYGNQIALSFHPEVDDDLSIHKEFLKLIHK